MAPTGDGNVAPWLASFAEVVSPLLHELRAHVITIENHASELLPALQTSFSGGGLDGAGASFVGASSAAASATASRLLSQLSFPAGALATPLFTTTEGVPVTVLDVAGASTAALLLLSLARPRSAAATELSCVYDPDQAAAYFSARPLLALQRQAALVREALVFGTALAADAASGQLDQNMPARASELRALIVRQGAAFIKVGQAVAIRPDVLPPPYLTEFAKLLDQVPPFEPVAAAAALRAALASRGISGGPESVFVSMDAFERPVASASIGQVYRARLKEGGKEVAVKLQRPDILQSVSLDLHIIRSAVRQLSRLRGAPGSLPARTAVQAAAFIEVLDTAATRFLEELDYEQEARNSQRFAALMADCPSVRDSIVVPSTVASLSSRGVLVQEWIEGTRLADISRETEAGRKQCSSLVRTLLLSYMAQLLETGLLHADPHPGNFLLMADGRVAILDYGMVTEITADQRIAFVEYMAHLSAKQYENTVDDLTNLGFLSPELSSVPANRALIAPAIASTLEILYGSGGGLSAQKVDALREQSKIAALSEELKAISRLYPVRLPPYFVLILRAFGTLEGLGLGVEGDFQILQECFPLVARRLLTDDSPRVRAALRTFVYGAEGDRLSVERVEMVIEGLRSFSETMDNTSRAGAIPAAAASTQLALPPPSASAALAPLATSAVATPPPPPVDAATLEMLKVLLSAEGCYAQELVLDELVRSVDALSREAALGLLAAAQPPLPFLPRLPMPRLSEEDVATLAIIRRLAVLVVPVGGALRPQQAPPQDVAGLLAAVAADVRGLAETGRRLAPLAPVLGPGVQKLGERFAQRLGARLVRRFTEDAREVFPGSETVLAQMLGGTVAAGAEGR